MKPTGILTLRVPFSLPAVGPAIGRNHDGSFKTASLKEYPGRVSQGFAQCTVDMLQRVSQTGVWRFGSESSRLLMEWCETALRATEGINDHAVMMPDSRLSLDDVAFGHRLRFKLGAGSEQQLMCANLL